MKAALALIVVAAAARSAAAGVEVCPVLNSSEPSSQFWDSEDLWPSCPVSSPVQSIGGRCVGGAAHCMQPCASTFEKDTKKAHYAYTYDASGGLTDVTGNDGIVDVHETCTRDAGGHRTKCQMYLGGEKFAYKAGKLERADLVTGVRTYKRDAKGRVVVERWQGKHELFTVTYTYNADGTVAKHVIGGDKEKPATVAMTYDHGRLVKVHTMFGDTAYTYDDHGRVTVEELTGNYLEHITYAYDDQGRLLELVEGTPKGKEITKYQYRCP